MNTRTAAVIIFYDKDHKILLQDRRNYSKHGEEWGFFGGSLKKGELKEDAIRREVQEELSYYLKTIKFIKTVEYTLEHLRATVHVFIAPFPGASAFIQMEGTGMKLFTIAEAKKLNMVSGDYTILDMLEKELPISSTNPKTLS